MTHSMNFVKIVVLCNHYISVDIFLNYSQNLLIFVKVNMESSFIYEVLFIIYQKGKQQIQILISKRDFKKYHAILNVQG
jgi:hypothetical protein